MFEYIIAYNDVEALAVKAEFRDVLVPNAAHPQHGVRQPESMME